MFSGFSCDIFLANEYGRMEFGLLSALIVERYDGRPSRLEKLFRRVHRSEPFRWGTIL